MIAVSITNVLPSLCGLRPAPLSGSSRPWDTPDCRGRRALRPWSCRGGDRLSRVVHRRAGHAGAVRVRLVGRRTARSLGGERPRRAGYPGRRRAEWLGRASPPTTRTTGRRWAPRAARRPSRRVLRGGCRAVEARCQPTSDPRVGSRGSCARGGPAEGSARATRRPWRPRVIAPSCMGRGECAARQEHRGEAALQGGESRSAGRPRQAWHS
jgi:hypothetical protein